MNPYTQEQLDLVIEYYNSPEQQIMDNNIIILDSLIPRIEEIFDNQWRKANNSFDQLQYILENVSQVIDIPDSIELASLYDKLGRYNQYATNNHEAALRHYHLSLKVGQIVYENNHPEIIESLNNIGDSNLNLGKYNNALIYYTKALKLIQHSPLELAMSFNRIGITYEKLGDYPESLKYLTKAKDLRIEVLGERHADVAFSLSNISFTQHKMGDHYLAFKNQEKAFELLIEILGPFNLYTSAIFNNIGIFYEELGRYDEALKCQLNALKIREKLFEEKHLYTAASLNNVGNVYRSINKNHEALEYQLKALDIRKELLGMNHPDVATSLNNIGLTFKKIGDHQKALKYLEQALEVWSHICKNNEFNIEKINSVEHENFAILYKKFLSTKYYETKKALFELKQMPIDFTLDKNIVDVAELKDGEVPTVGETLVSE